MQSRQGVGSEVVRFPRSPVLSNWSLDLIVMDFSWQWALVDICLVKGMDIWTNWLQYKWTVPASPTDVFDPEIPYCRGPLKSSHCPYILDHHQSSLASIIQTLSTMVSSVDHTRSLTTTGIRLDD